jgi:hypothetical protein
LAGAIADPEIAARAAAGRRAAEDLGAERAGNEEYEHYRATARDKQGGRLSRPPNPYQPPVDRGATYHHGLVVPRTVGTLADAQERALSSHELGEPMPKLGVGVFAVLLRTRPLAADRTGRGTHGVVACDRAGRGSYDVAAGRAGRRLAELGWESALRPTPSPDA